MEDITICISLSETRLLRVRPLLQQNGKASNIAYYGCGRITPPVSPTEVEAVVSALVAVNTPEHTTATGVVVAVTGHILKIYNEVLAVT